MIVKNEGARIGRALRSVLPHVKAVAILDTGSTDDTKEVIERMCQQYRVHYVIAEGEFVNYSQARNDAFKLAKEFNKDMAWCQFALLMDADMELVVNNEKPFFDLNARAVSYNMTQKGGAISYFNRRLINLQVGKDEPYVGVTHEYIDLECNGSIDAADIYFADHGDGANRPGKYERDARLLEQGLIDEPHNSRYMFYLGNTYHEAGQHEKAVAAYDKHIAADGWDEEVHQSKMFRAKSLRELKDISGFVTGMLDAYQFRPRRAEPLYELARHYRETGPTALALMFAKHGMNIPRPNDLLFVNDYVYAHGLRYEYAVAGYYDDKERNAAFQMTDDLSLDPTLNDADRWSCRSNLWWFLKPLSEYCPSFSDKKIEFTPPVGYTAMNPSVVIHEGEILCNIRTVNYKIDEHGRYMIGPKECHDAPIDTRNFIAELDDGLSVVACREVDWVREPVWEMVTGLEDIRLQSHANELWFNACVREQCATGTCQQWEGRLIRDGFRWRVVNARSMTDQHAVEKNWMPIQGLNSYVYRLDKIAQTKSRPGFLDGDEVIIEKHEAKVRVGDISGGSQAIPFRSGWLMVVHEASVDPCNGKRTYWHRFAWLNHDFELRRLSLPFVFLDKQIEFCAGLAYHPNGDDLILSYGIRDAEAHLGTVKVEEVAQMIWKFYES
jgi:glycosyltransferase involved in cell wall biosynthesis